MRPYLCLAILLLSVTSLKAADKAADVPSEDGEETELVTPPEELSKAIKNGLKLLKEKQYKALIEQLLDPDDLKTIDLTNENIQKFATEKSALFLLLFEAIQTSKVKLSANGKMATFECEPKVEGKGWVGVKVAVKFHKVGEKWYIRK